MRAVRTGAGALGAAVMLAVMLPLGSSAASAPAVRLGLSADGIGPWTSTLTEPVFDDDARWAPGDVRTGEFWARNQSTDATQIQLVIMPKDGDLHASGDLDVQVRTDGDAWQPLSAAWTSPRPLAAGSTARVQVRAALSETAPNADQAQHFAFDVRTRLTQVTGTEPTDPTPTPTTAPTETPTAQSPTSENAPDDRVESSPTRDGSLPSTGAELPSWLVPAGIGAAITGLWLALGARRNREESDAS
ncbi:MULTISPECIES: LPXTG cell wall anchor domain-containing protein [unclassified Aeromicrobium]|uniref:LPXTG cell wall anchor domain-containing protein n=1 Tax=unclassified Aeromicrobium TaxID=2633570 RepID=UPI00396B14A6